VGFGRYAINSFHSLYCSSRTLCSRIVGATLLLKKEVVQMKKNELIGFVLGCSHPANMLGAIAYQIMAISPCMLRDI